MIKLTKEQYKGSVPQKNKKKKKSAAIVVTSVVMLMIAVFCILSLTVLFKIERIEIDGNLTYSDEEVISVSGVEAGDNLIRVSGEKVSSSLQSKLPFISSVKTTRKFPSTLKITVEETKEELCIYNGSKYYSADLSGKVLKGYYGAVSEELISVTVPKSTSLTAGEKISFESERETELFEEYTELIESDMFTVNFVNISDQFDSYVKIEDRIIVKFGSVSYFEEKLAYLSSGLPKLPNDVTGVFDLSTWTPENDTPRFRPQSIAEYEN